MLTYDQPESDRDGITDKLKILFDGYQEMFDQSLSKSKDLVDLLDILRSMHEMAELQRIKLPVELSPGPPPYPRHPPNRASDPKLQHISICRHLLFLLDAADAFNNHLIS